MCLDISLSGNRLVIRHACNAWRAWQPLAVKIEVLAVQPGAQRARGMTVSYLRAEHHRFSVSLLLCYIVGVLFSQAAALPWKKWHFAASCACVKDVDLSSDCTLPQVAKVPLKDWVVLSGKGDVSFRRIGAGNGNFLNRCTSSCCVRICPLKLTHFQPGNPRHLGVTSQTSCLGMWAAGAWDCLVLCLPCRLHQYCWAQSGWRKAKGWLAAGCDTSSRKNKT